MFALAPLLPRAQVQTVGYVDCLTYPVRGTFLGMSSDSDASLSYWDVRGLLTPNGTRDAGDFKERIVSHRTPTFEADMVN